MSNKEPIAWVCTSCEADSDYSKAHNDRPPKGWKDTEQGFMCDMCALLME